VGIAGVPGSGKSTTAREVCAKINTMRPRLDKHHVAVVVGMDGERRHACRWCTEMHLHVGLWLLFQLLVSCRVSLHSSATRSISRS